MTIRIRLTRLPHGEGLPLPSYATHGAAGMDVVAAEDLDLMPGQLHAVATGFKVAIPEGYEIQVRPRSGLALKHGITVPNTPGTIDSDYRGQLKVIMVNHGSDPFPIRRGERIAQLVPAAVTTSSLAERTGRDRHNSRPLAPLAAKTVPSPLLCTRSRTPSPSRSAIGWPSDPRRLQGRAPSPRRHLRSPPTSSCFGALLVNTSKSSRLSASISTGRTAEIPLP